MLERNPYRPMRAEVLEVRTETPTIKTIRFKPEKPLPFRTGQFVEISVPGVGEAPFTPSSRPSIADVLEVSVMRVGKVTEKIHQLAAGNVIGVRGPFGNGYPVDDFTGKEVLVIGGGCGFAPLRSLMYAFFELSGQLKKLSFRGGCKSPTEFLYRQEIEGWASRPDLDLRLTVDKGDATWTGNVGVVTTILDNVDTDRAGGRVVLCGPPIMMKFGAKKVLEMGFPAENIYLSMEKNMSCGLGKCGHCRIGTFYCCKDGPVFRFDRIRDLPDIWD